MTNTREENASFELHMESLGRAAWDCISDHPDLRPIQSDVSFDAWFKDLSENQKNKTATYDTSAEMVYEVGVRQTDELNLFGHLAYHLTPLENLMSILNTGLIPAIGPRSQKFGEAYNYVYLFEDIEDVFDATGCPWAEDAWDPEDPLALLEVCVQGTSSQKDGLGIKTDEIILPKKIRVVSLDIWAEIDLRSMRKVAFDPKEIFKPTAELTVVPEIQNF